MLKPRNQKPQGKSHQNGHSLDQLATLLKESKVFNGPTTAAGHAKQQEEAVLDAIIISTLDKITALGILPDDDVDLACWKLMKDCVPRTPEEIFKVLNACTVETDVEEISVVMAHYNTHGICTRKLLAHPGSNSFSYTFKAGAHAMQPHTTQFTKPRMPFRDQRVADIDPVGVIKASEGLDVCIWKAMADRKPRTAAEIGAIVSTYGIDRRGVQDRAISLMKRGWFQRGERGNVTTYTLKKNIPMPAIAPEVKAPAPAGVDKEKAGPVSVIAKGTLAHVPLPTVGLSVVPKIDPEPVLPLAMAPNVNEGLDACIWRVMFDRKPYTVAEVAGYLSIIGINANSTSSRMSKLYNNEKWFNLGPVDTSSGRKTRTYILRFDIQLPKDCPPYTGTLTIDKPDASPAVNKEEPKQAPVAATQQPIVKAEEEMKHTTPAAPAKPPAKAAESQVQRTPVVNTELVSFHVNIKGLKFSFEETETLANELITTGVGLPEKSASLTPASLLGINITIKGTVFSKAEIVNVTAALVNAGFGNEAKQQA